MWFLLVLMLGIGALGIWMWKRPDPVKRDQAKAVQHDLWIEQLDAQLRHAARLSSDPEHPNYARAYQIYQNLAQQQEIPQAYVGMGLMHLQGLGHEQNTETAISYLDKAFHLGSDEAAYHLGQIHEDQRYQMADPEKALYWYRHAVARGNLDAQYRITELSSTEEKNPEDKSAEQQRLALLIQNAGQGHANSQYKLAQYYLADSATQDLVQGIHYLFLAAQQDHLAANQQIAHAYARGQILPQDPTQALQFIKRCISLGDQKGLYDYYAGVLQGRIDTDQRQRVFQHLMQQSKEHADAQAKTLIGQAYFHGWYVDKNETMAFRYWSEAGNTQHPRALCTIAALYFEQHLVANEPQKAFELYQVALQLSPDDAYAQMGLALYYLNSIGTAKDTAKATRMIQAVVQQYWQIDAQSEADLIYAVGRFYSLAEYPLPTREKAVQYLNQAVSKGSKEAAWFLYQALSGIYPVFVNNAEQANRYLHQAAQLGHAQAQAELGLIYLNGQKLQQDMALGLTYLQQAAVQKNSVALNALGEAFENGRGTEANIEQAVQYYHQAAAQVNADAYSHLGRLYTKGIGVERDIGIARDWLEKGSLLGHERSAELLKNVNAYLQMK